ncbi:MAG TPA: hypothetical protein VGM05_13555 [Planctomycetaceae bacterium]|jgi:hypothetical protein
MKQRPKWTLVGLVAALLIYILGIGPVHGFACFVNRPWIWRTTNSAYRPLALVCRESEILTRGIILYTQLWEFRLPPMDGKVYPPGFEWGDFDRQ